MNYIYRLELDGEQVTGRAAMSKTRAPQACAIAFANGKGGVGKTSLIANLAVRAARDAHVALLDYDPQQSLARWCELRANAYGNQLNPRLWKNGEGAPVDVPALKKLGTHWIFRMCRRLRGT